MKVSSTKMKPKDMQVKICDLYTWIRSDSLISEQGIMKLRYYLKKPLEAKMKDTRFSRIVYYVMTLKFHIIAVNNFLLYLMFLEISRKEL